MKLKEVYGEGDQDVGGRLVVVCFFETNLVLLWLCVLYACVALVGDPPRVTDVIMAVRNFAVVCI